MSEKPQKYRCRFCDDVNRGPCELTFMVGHFPDTPVACPFNVDGAEWKPVQLRNRRKKSEAAE